jgi:hypothetical protein
LLSLLHKYIRPSSPRSPCSTKRARPFTGIFNLDVPALVRRVAKAGYPSLQPLADQRAQDIRDREWVGS